MKPPEGLNVSAERGGSSNLIPGLDISVKPKLIQKGLLEGKLVRAGGRWGRGVVERRR